MPKRAELVTQYARVINAAKGHNVTFRTLDIGSDKVLSYMAPQDEPNPAMGWRAILGTYLFIKECSELHMVINFSIISNSIIIIDAHWLMPSRREIKD